MKKWQRTLTIVLGSMLVLLGVGFVICTFVF